MAEHKTPAFQEFEQLIRDNIGPALQASYDNDDPIWDLVRQFTAFPMRLADMGHESGFGCVYNPTLGFEATDTNLGCLVQLNQWGD